MKNLKTYLIILALIVSSNILLFCSKNKSSEVEFKIYSTAFENNQPIPEKYTCDGENINPPLFIEGVPAGTKSLVLIVDDPDAPMGIFTHWTLWNISKDIKSIPENSVPNGAVQGKTGFGTYGYGGPCPPSGVHRYIFKVYALNCKLDLKPETTKDELEKALQGKVISIADFTGTYEYKE